MNAPHDISLVYDYEADSGIAFLISLLILISILALIFHVVISIWIYKDARKRKMEAAIWVLIVLVSSVIGVIVYLIVRDPIMLEKSIQPTHIAPPTYSYAPLHPTLCDSPVPKDRSEKFCRFCGKKMGFDANFCPHCGKNT